MKRDFSQFKKEINGKKVAVVGVGVSNIPLITFLIKLGAKVTAFDKREYEKLDNKVDAFKNEVEFSLGDNYLEKLTGFDYIFRTPGMRPDNEYLEKARKEGSIITSEIQEFIRHCKGHVIGVTGSDGKSTTTTLIHEILKASGKNAFIGGNIGFPLFDQVEKIKEDDYAVMELSSFQLMDMTVSPEIAIVTNLSPNHLDVHKDMEEYEEAKKNIFKFQDENGILVINKDNEITKKYDVEAKGKVYGFSSKKPSDAYLKGDDIVLFDEVLLNRKDMKIRGIHNAENLMAAALATYNISNKEAVIEVAENFPGVKHRCQYVRNINGAAFYNDSIASSPTRTLATVKSFIDDKSGKINLILGGYDKNLDYDVLFEEGLKHLGFVVLYGAAGPKIEKSLLKFIENEKENKVLYGENFDDAVRLLVEHSKEEDVSILSPACASFDAFKNFEERGERFKVLINQVE